MSNFINFTEVANTSYVADIVDATTTYHGWYVAPDESSDVTASVATVDTGASIFKIAKETKDVSGNTISMQYATKGFNCEWDNRATLTYF